MRDTLTDPQFQLTVAAAYAIGYLTNYAKNGSALSEGHRADLEKIAGELKAALDRVLRPEGEAA